MERKGGSDVLASLIKNRWTERVVDLILVPVLLITSLWLPPVSIGARFFNADYPLVTPDEGGIVPGPDGARLSIPAGAVEKRSRIRLETLSRGDLAQAEKGTQEIFAASVGSSHLTKLRPDSPEFLALQGVPQDIVAYEPFYHLDVRGASPSHAECSLPIPRELAAVETADLFGWDGETWHWLPSQITPDGGSLHAKLDQVPLVMVVAQNQPKPLRVDLGASGEMPKQIAQDMETTYVSLQGLTLGGEGRLVEQTPIEAEARQAASLLAATGQPRFLLSISNIIDGVVRSDLVDNLIVNEPLRKTHIYHILSESASFAGVEIAYRGVDRELRPEFTAFITEMAEALHEVGKILAVRVDIPRPSGMDWDTGAYDWRTLGQVADLLRIPAITDPAAYTEGGEMDQLLSWATGEVDRRKIDLAITAYAHDLAEAETGQVTPPLEPITYRDALGSFAQSIVADDKDGMLLPGESVNLSLPDLQKLSLQFDAEAQVYWFTYQDDQGRPHTVWLENASSVARKLQYVNRYALGGASIQGALNERNDQDIPQVVQTFRDNQVSPDPRFVFVWTIRDGAGKTIDQQVLPLSNPNWTWTAPNNPGNYIIRAALSDDGGETDLGPASELGIEVPTPTFTPTPTPTSTPTPTNTPTPTTTPMPTPTPTNTPKPTPKPKPKARVASSPKVGGYFGYGIQADLITDTNHQRIYDHIKAMGFNWVKQQVEWFRYNSAPGQYDWGPLDRIVDSANANGINVLFSVVKAPKWSRPPGDTDEGPPADPNTYGTFMRELAARYKGRVKAYEIWNEQNLYYEWGGRGHKLNAAKYVELLKVGYNAVKSVDPGAVVISGALTPTGVSDGDIAIDDRVYLEQMYQAGLARYCDAVGAHPSGYNNPADADWRSWSDASAPSFKGHPSFFFRGTMESYRNIMVKYGDGHKRIWPTEFGWATVDGLGCAPAEGYGYAGDNDCNEQAQFIVRAYQMGKAWGWVGPMFLWNLNFAPVAGKTDEKAAFGIVTEGWGARPAFAALRDMPK